MEPAPRPAPFSAGYQPWQGTDSYFLVMLGRQWDARPQRKPAPLCLTAKPATLFPEDEGGDDGLARRPRAAARAAAPTTPDPVEIAMEAEASGTAPTGEASALLRRQSLLIAFVERGQMLMTRGDTAGAIGFHEQAVERGPRWADPQNYWGDALMAQRDEHGAIRKYRAAADRAEVVRRLGAVG